MLRTLRTIVFLVLTLVFFATGQALGGYYQGVLWWMAAGSVLLALAAS